jgi:diaminopimelate epimerase
MDCVRFTSLVKYHTLGNSYLVFDPKRNGLVDPEVPIAADWIRTMCDPNSGLGSNGLLVGPDRSGKGGFDFRIFNSDASQAQLSGNGSRIFARYLLDAGYVRPDEHGFFLVAVSEQLDRIRVDVNAREGADSMIDTRFQISPRFGPQAVGAAGTTGTVTQIEVTVPVLAAMGRRVGVGDKGWSDSTMVRIGNPHCVTFVRSYQELPSSELLRRIHLELSSIADAPDELSDNSTFEDGCNLQWCFVESRDRLHLRIFERGEGMTFASGSSAAAAAMAAFARGAVDRRVSVRMQGGKLDLTLLTQSCDIVGVEMTARVQFVANIEVPNLEIRDYSVTSTTHGDVR